MSAATAAGGVYGFPAALTSFVGRAEAMREVAGLLEEHRLVTVTGPGGVGKTRLAVQVARAVAGRFADGAWLAELAPVSKAAQVPGVVAAALGVREPRLGREAAQPQLDRRADRGRGGGRRAGSAAIMPAAWAAVNYIPNDSPGQAPTDAVVTAGGMPGWQITLIALGSALVAAAVAVLLDRTRTARRAAPAATM